MRIRCSLDPKRESNRLEKRVPIRKRDMGDECENGEGFGYGVKMGSVWGIVEMVVIMGMVKIQVTMI